jgi:predicted DNA-binding protein with PD1-like motif
MGPIASALAALQPLPVRLHPGDDLRRALEQAATAHGAAAAFVLSAVGSLRPARLRLAGAEATLDIDADVELLTLSGTLAPGASHLHMSVSDAQGRVLGGHVAYGCIVRTTAEVLLALLPGWRFSRQPDPATGWAELVIEHAPSSPGPA